MRTGGELRGIAAVRASEGVKIGRFQDIVFDITNGRITGFVLDEVAAGSKHEHFLPAALLQSLGADAAMLSDASDSLAVFLPEETPAGMVSVRALSGRPVLNETGTVLGRIADVQINEQALSIHALLMKTGLLSKVFGGSTPVPFDRVRAIGVDSVVLSGDYDPRSAAPAEEKPA